MRRYHINEDYFSVIDSQDKAYILGWFYSDGNVRLDGKCRITIQERDTYIFDYFNKYMKYNGPVINIKRRNERCQPQKCFQFHSVKIVKQLIQLGCHPNKSHTLVFPNKDQVPHNLIWHFVRGVFDGDGHVKDKPTSNHLSCSITSCPTFICGLSELCTSAGINYKIYSRKRSEMLYILRRFDAYNFLSHIYKDADAKLLRKYRQYKAFTLGNIRHLKERNYDIVL